MGRLDGVVGTSVVHRDVDAVPLVSMTRTDERAPVGSALVRRLVLPLLIVVAALGVGACGSDDSAADSTTSTPGGFTLSSSAFGESELIPDDHAFGDDNESPPLQWSGVPDGTEELGLAVVDPDASNFVHWVVAGIDPSTTGLEAGEVPPGAVEALNSFNEASWSGPAPPAGSRHTYVFTLYALPEASGVTDEMTAQDAIEQFREKATATAQLRGEYETPS
jgi:Raf kinase inhibitor-like YbhB/YbcL family protein